MNKIETKNIIKDIFNYIDFVINNTENVDFSTFSAL